MFGTLFSFLLITLVAAALFGWWAAGVLLVVMVVGAWIIEAAKPGTFT